MGTGQSSEIPKKSPSGCTLKHWKQLGGVPGGNMRRDLIKYYNHLWPLYKLNEGEKWPVNGMLNYNVRLQLTLFLRCEQKWDKVMYCNLFFTLKNLPERQKDCGINIPPSNPFVLSLEKERNKKVDNKLKRCCSACSIGQRSLKLYKQE